MDIRMLNYFLTIAEEQNITHAAQKLHIAQPPLSRQLSQLEAELGTPLFIRGGKKLELTTEGRLLKERAQQILQLVNRTKSEISETVNGVSGTIYIGSTETISSTMLPKWISGFKKRYPLVKYNVWSGNSDEAIERLEQGLLDFAIVREPYNQEHLTGYRIHTEPWCALLHGDSKLAKLPGDTLPLRMLENEDIIVPAIKFRKAEIQSWFDQIHCEANIFCEYAPLINGIYLVEQNAGVAILPSSVSNVIRGRNLVLKRLIEPESNSHTVVLTRKYQIISNTAQKMLDYIGSTIPS
jgi:DNA-binding transcriptional LysR family regulator